LKDFAYRSRLFAYLAERHDLLFETRDDYNHPNGQTMASLRHQSLGLASVSYRASIKSALLAVTENQNDQIANRSRTPIRDGRCLTQRSTGCLTERENARATSSATSARS
jgi:hypothetical protein